MPNDIHIEDIPLAQGPAKPLVEGEVAPDQYELIVGAVNSFRTTKHTVHDEASTTSEIP